MNRETLTSKHELWDKIDWSEDEYTWYQYIPTDTKEKWNEWLTQYQLVKDKEPLHGPQHNYKHLEVFNIDDIFYRVNTNGFRADTFKKNDNRLKIMSLGCSFTFGIGVMQGDEWPNKLAQKYNAVTIDQVNAAAKKYLDPEAWTWFIVGDLSIIEEDIRNLGLGEVEIIVLD